MYRNQQHNYSQQQQMFIQDQYMNQQKFSQQKVDMNKEFDNKQKFNITPSKSFDKSDDIEQSVSKGQLIEGDIISNLIEEKKKAIILVSKGIDCYQIDQEKVPLNKLKIKNKQIKINQVEDIANDRQLSALKSQVNDLQLENNALQQNNLQLKSKIKELNEMVFGLTDIEKNHDLVKRIMDLHKKNDELSKNLFSHIKMNKDLEEEVEKKKIKIEQLKKQISEKQYSFAIGNNSINRIDNFPLEQSSIEQNEYYNSNKQIPDYLQVRVQSLETELEEYGKIRVQLESQNKQLKTEIEEIKQSIGQQNNDDELQEQLKHIRSILI